MNCVWTLTVWRRKPYCKLEIGLIDVDLSLVFEGVCKVAGKIVSVMSPKVLNEKLLWDVSEKLLLHGDVCSLT